MKLEGRTCVFAGASGGDGAAAVKALCAGGMNVVMMTHQPAQAQKLSAKRRLPAARRGGRSSQFRIFPAERFKNKTAKTAISIWLASILYR